LKIQVFLCFVFSCAIGQEIPAPKWVSSEKGISKGRLVKGSTSPDGRFALFEFNHWEGEGETTATAVGLAPVDRSQLLYAIESCTEWQTNKKVISFLTFKWNPTSEFLATHDSLAKNSALHLYKLRDGKAIELALPDLLTKALAQTQLTKKNILSSGQIPEQWLEDNRLKVFICLNTNAGQQTIPLILTIQENGSVSVE